MSVPNKPILCFLDESGTAGGPYFVLGCVMVWASECGQADKVFSDLLPSNVNELHAVNRTTEFLQRLLTDYAQNSNHPKDKILMNKLETVSTTIQSALHASDVRRPVRSSIRSAIYADNVIQTVKVAIREFRKLNAISNLDAFGNVKLILDANPQNTNPDCQRMIFAGLKDVNEISPIDSAASRLLQLADVVTYSHRWIRSGQETSMSLRKKYGILAF